MVSRAKRIFSNAHTYHINSIGVSSDQAMFLSADDLRINLWSLEVPNRCFNMVDIKPANMEQLSEVCLNCVTFMFEHCYFCRMPATCGGDIHEPVELGGAQPLLQNRDVEPTNKEQLSDVV